MNDDLAIIGVAAIGGYLIWKQYWGGGVITPDPNAPGGTGTTVTPDPNKDSVTKTTVYVPPSQATGTLAPFYSAGWDFEAQARANSIIPDTGNHAIDDPNNLFQAIPGLAQINTAGYEFGSWLKGALGG